MNFRLYTLDPIIGSILEISKPTGLEIRFDDEAVGISPLYIEKLVPGRYKGSAKQTEYSNNPVLDSILRVLPESRESEYEKTVTMEVEKVTDVFLGVRVIIPENSMNQTVNQTEILPSDYFSFQISVSRAFTLDNSSQ